MAKSFPALFDFYHNKRNSFTKWKLFSFKIIVSKKLKLFWGERVYRFFETAHFCKSFKNVPYVYHHNLFWITNHSWILTIHRGRIFWKNIPERTFLTFKKWAKKYKPQVIMERVWYIVSAWLMSHILSHVTQSILIERMNLKGHEFPALPRLMYLDLISVGFTNLSSWYFKSLI